MDSEYDSTNRTNWKFKKWSFQEYTTYLHKKRKFEESFIARGKNKLSAASDVKKIHQYHQKWDQTKYQNIPAPFNSITCFTMET